MSESNGREVAKIAPARLPFDSRIEERFGVDAAGWRTLTDAIFPSATSTASVVLALSYCRARKLDVFKKPVQIVPMWDDKRNQLVDTVWPGIGELRTTAARTAQYAGCDEALFGDMVELDLDGVKLRAPEWCSIVVYRIVAGQRCAFHGPKVYWLETYATKKKDTKAPNKMWGKRPIGQLEKCAEAAALRKAFPEELGNEYVAEEMEGKTIDMGEIVLPDEDQSGQFLEGDVKNLIVKDVTRQMEGAMTKEALEKVWASMRRKYYNNTTKRISHLTYEGFEHTKERIERWIDGSENKWMLSVIESFRGPGDADDLRNQVRWGMLSQSQRDGYEVLIEQKLEALAEEVAA